MEMQEPQAMRCSFALDGRSGYQSRCKNATSREKLGYQMKGGYLIIYPCCLVIEKILIRESDLEARLLFSYIIYVLSLFLMPLGFFLIFKKTIIYADFYEFLFRLFLF